MRDVTVDLAYLVSIEDERDKLVKERDELAKALLYLKRFDESLSFPPEVDSILFKYLEQS